MKNSKSYKNLEIFVLAKELAVKVHLEILHETDSLKKNIFEKLLYDYEELCAKLFNFLKAVIDGHRVS